MAKKKGKGSKTSGPPKADGDGKAILGRRAVEIKRHFPAGQPTIFANNFVVQHEESTFSLLFFEVKPPLILEAGEEARKIAESINHIDADCVARVVVPAHIMPGILEALAININTYQAKTSGKAEVVDVNGQATQKH